MTGGVAGLAAEPAASCAPGSLPEALRRVERLSAGAPVDNGRREPPSAGGDHRLRIAERPTPAHLVSVCESGSFEQIVDGLCDLAVHLLRGENGALPPAVMGSVTAEEWASVCAEATPAAAARASDLVARAGLDAVPRLFDAPDGPPVNSNGAVRVPACLAHPPRLVETSRRWVAAGAHGDHPALPLLSEFAASQSPHDARRSVVLPRALLHPAAQAPALAATLLRTSPDAGATGRAAALPLRLAVELATLVPPAVRDAERPIRLPALTVEQMLRLLWPDDPCPRGVGWRRERWVPVTRALRRLSGMRFAGGRPLVFGLSLPDDSARPVARDAPVGVSLTPMISERGPRIHRDGMRLLGAQFGAGWLVMLRSADHWDRRVSRNGTIPPAVAKTGNMAAGMKRLVPLGSEGIAALAAWSGPPDDPAQRRHAVTRARRTLTRMADADWLRIAPAESSAVYGRHAQPAATLNWRHAGPVRILPPDWWPNDLNHPPTP